MGENEELVEKAESEESNYNMDKAIKERDEMASVLLTALVMDYDNSKNLLDTLRLADFQSVLAYLNPFRVEEEIFQNVLDLEKANRPISALSVTALMEEEEKTQAYALFEKGKVEYDKLKVSNVSLASVADRYKELKRRVKLRYILSQAQRSVEQGSADICKVIEEVHTKIDTVEKTSEIPTITQRDLNVETFFKLTNAPDPFYPTGFAQIDRRIRGFVQKRTYAVCARTSQGKSAMLLNMVANLGKDKVPVGFISLEMSNADMNQRLWSIAGGIEARRFHEYPMSDDMKYRCRQIHRLTESWPLYWSDGRGMTLADVKSKMSQFARQGCKVVMIDFIQRIVVESKEPYHLQVALIAKTLSDLADRLNIAVVIATQANREGAKNPNGELELHNIADSTAIEQACDVVILMHRKEKDDTSLGYNIPMKVKVAKNRHGATGYFDMFFCGREYKFSDAPLPQPSTAELEHMKQSAGNAGRRSIPTPVPIPEIKLIEERKQAMEESRAIQN